MFIPLVQALITRHGLPLLTSDNLDAFLAAHEDTLLFFSGDGERLDESADAAVVLPELLKAFGGRLAAGVVARNMERDMQRMYRFSAFPAMVLLRRGEYLGAISRMRDWDVYIREISDILAREPSDPPPFKLPGGAGKLRVEENDHAQ